MPEKQAETTKRPTGDDRPLKPGEFVVNDGGVSKILKLGAEQQQVVLTQLEAELQDSD